MELSFPHDLCFYGTCCDIIDTLVIDIKTRSSLIIMSH